MKTKIKRHSRSVLSVILAICILISCMVAGLIATDAAKTAGQRVGAKADDEVLGDGDTTYYMHIGAGSAFRTTSGNAFTYDSTNSYYYYDYAITANTEYVFVINTTSGTLGDGNKSSSTQTVTTLASSWNDTGATFHYNSYGSNIFDGYDAFKFKCSSAITIRFTFTSTFADGVTYRLSSGGGGESGGDDPEPSDDTTTTTVNQKSGNTLIVSYDKQNNRDYTHVWFDGESAYINGETSDGAMTSASTATGVTGLYYKDITSATTSTTKQIDFLCKKGTGWNTNKSGDVKQSNFKKGKQWYLYNSASSGNYSDTNGEYDPLELVSVENPSVIKKDQAASFTVNVEGGVPKFMSTRGDTNVTYKLSVGTSSGGTQVLNASTCKYAAKKFTFNWTPSSSGDVTLYYTLTDGIDTVTYSKAYTVIQPEAKHAVTISASPSEGGTVSPSTGTEVGVSTSTEITATPSAGYEFSSWTFGTGITGASTSTNPTTITTNSSGDYTVQANFTAKPTHTITVNTNNSAYGTASASVASAYQGQEVTLTATESTGTFSNWTVNSGSVTVSGNTKSATFTMGSSDVSITANFAEYTPTASPFYYNSYGNNGQPAATHYGAQMTEAEINGETFSYYHVTGRTESDQLFTVSYGSPKYNSYNTYFQFPKSWGGTAEVQFYTTDGQNLGNYTNMTADGEENGKLKWKYPIPDGAREVQFKHGSDYSGKLNFASGNNAWYAESKMNEVSGWNSSNPVPTNFYENFNSNKYTDAFSTNGFNSHYADRGESHAYTKPKGLDNTTKGDYYIVVLYENKTYTINGVNKKITNNPEIIWMSELPTAVEDTTETVDIYAKDGTLRDGYQKFSEFAQTTITAIKNADGTDNTTALAAVKRYNYQNTGTNTTQAGDTNTGTTRYDYAKATGIPVGSTITVRTRLYQKSQWKDDWYGSNFNDTHYVKAFCVNGVAPEVYTWKGATGSNKYTDYEMTYTITEEDVALDRSNNGYIEITPIIYLKDSTYTKTFYIEGYDRDDERYKTLGWGTTLGIYPYYDGKKESENGFGGYPGQPMLFYKGRYEIQVPLTHDGTSSGAKCLGITLSNNYWDLVHRSLDKSIQNNDKGHRQTYDFDDFYKIKEEKNPDQITFSFKLRTNNLNNFGDGYARDNFDYADNTEKTLYRDTNNVLYKSDEQHTVFSRNGIDEYKDGLNRDINLFGTVLSAHQAEQPKLLVVSNGYKYTYVGKYATEWVVYKNEGVDETGMTKYTYVTQIAPSALVLNSLDSFSAYTGGSSTTAATKPKPLGNYQAAYTTLSGADYVDKAFEICYESSQYINTDDKADRLDGRWLYTKNGDKISATVKIQYKNASQTEWTDEASYTTGYDSKNNKGAVTNAQAYFTNVTPKDLDGLMTAADIPIVPGSYFTFKTVAPTDQDHMNYVFRGWYVSLNGSDPVAVDKVPQLESMLEMTGNAVIIARYEELTSGVLTIRHDIETNDTYKGTGTPYLKVELLNGSNQVKDTYAMTANGQYLTTKYLTTAYASNNYKFKITLKAVGANSDNTYEDTTESGSLNTMSMAPTSGTVNSDEGKYFTVPISSLFTDGTLTVKSLVYKTHFNLTEYNYKYVINYKFPTRLYGDEVYKVESGNISGNKMSAYFDGTKESAKVKKNIISGNTPFESNFMKKMNWDYDTAYSGTISSATDYANGGQIVTPTTIGTSTTYTVYVTVIADDNTKLNVNAFFMLPYQYNETTKAAISYDVYNGKNTYDSSKDRGSGSDKYELYIDGVREFNNLTDEQLKAQTTNRKYLMYDESAAENSPRRVFDNLVPLTSASTTTQNGEDKIVGYDNTVSGFTLSAPMGTLITYDGVNDRGKESHFVRAPEYIYVANGDTEQKDSWQHLSYGNVDYHTIRETTTFRTHDVTTNAQYVSYKNVKDGIVANAGYTKKYFSRWDIYSQSDSRYVASCYYYDFNYTSYEDIYVVPVYESSKPSAFIDEALEKNNMATVSFLDTTRNQWNVKINDSAPNAVADKLYTDFALSFGDGSTILSELKSTDTKKVRVGMLIERLDGLTGADTTKFATDTDSNVITAASSYVKAFDNNAKEAIANMLINDEGANSATYKSSTQAALYGNAANCKIASNDTWSTRDLTALDNKNRIEYYYGINKLLDSNQYKNYKYAYRAISYILVNEGSGWSAKISDPAYFTIYDTATQTVAG